MTKLGYEENVNFILSPILEPLIEIKKMESLKREIFFTSGSVPSNLNTNSGGGLYKLTIDGEDEKLTKIYSGPCYGMIKKGGLILFIDSDKGLFSYNKNNNKISLLLKTPKGSRAHGISYNISNKNYYITCSNLDCTIEYNSSFKETRRFNISEKYMKNNNEAFHHCNDNLSYNGSLFVSMFSSTGNWKNDVFDGCIAEFDLNTGKRLNDVCTGLYMPHNVKMYNDSIHILDSLRGHLRCVNFSIQGSFPGFTRGLDYDGEFYYVGQSKNRNFSQILGLSNNISISCGIIIFNNLNKISRFISTPMNIGEIHSVVCDK